MKLRRRNRRKLTYLFLGLLLVVFIIYIFFNYSPQDSLSISLISLPILPLFIITLALASGFLTYFATLSKTQSVVIAVFITTYLLLRINGFTHILFAGLTIALLITTELFILKKK